MIDCHFGVIIYQTSNSGVKKPVGTEIDDIFPDFNIHGHNFTDIIIHAKASCVRVMSLIITSDDFSVQ